ncbi:MAG TPA: tetratricopeptide repeat protein [Pyrinomonadaceae bacterium]|nr:tetratricopeptide repeat protein [Pyrinomonadaceae bacterium]
MATETPSSTYEFGEFRIDTLRMLLMRCDGEIIPLPPKAFDVLRIMIGSEGRVLTKDELLNEAWSGTIVEEGNLTQAISVLRRALGETRSDHRYIVTVPGSGYRFVAVVREVAPDVNDLSDNTSTPIATPQPASVFSSHEVTTAKNNSVSGTHQLRWILLVPALLLAAFGVYFAYSTWTTPPAPLPANVAEVRSIAVLPLENLGNQTDDEYLGVGIADALITKLSNIRRVAVRPTNAVVNYTHAKPPLTAIGSALKVDALLDGRVQRSGDRIRVTVQLVRTGDGVPLWAETFEDRFTNIFAVQDSIARKVTEALTLVLSGEEQGLIFKPLTENANAYEAYLRGRFFWNKRSGDGLQKGITYFEEAVRLDPEFALAYASLAESYVLLNLYGSEYRRDAFPKAREAAMKALSLNNALAPAHTALALVKLEYEYDWAGAEESYRTAIELNPNYATAHHWYAEYLSFVGRFDESIKNIELAFELDPQSLVINTVRGYPYMRSGRCDTAIGYFKKALEMEPKFALAHFYLGKCYVEQKQFSDAIKEQLAAISASGESAAFLAALSFAHAASGNRVEANALLNKMKETSRRSYVSPYSMATVYAGLGETDEAFKWLDKAYGDRDYQLPTIKNDIHFEHLKDDRRFAQLLERIGLPSPRSG